MNDCLVENVATGKRSSEPVSQWQTGQKMFLPVLNLKKS